MKKKQLKIVENAWGEKSSKMWSKGLHRPYDVLGAVWLGGVV